MYGASRLECIDEGTAGDPIALDGDYWVRCGVRAAEMVIRDIVWTSTYVASNEDDGGVGRMGMGT